MRRKKTHERMQTVVCICVDDSDLAQSLRKLLCDRIPSVRVALFSAPGEIGSSLINDPFFLLFSARETKWMRGDNAQAGAWFSDLCASSFALTDSAEPEFLRKLYKAGVDDYFLDVPGGHAAAVARIVRESQKRALSDVCSSAADVELAGESLARRVRRVTFRETVATINHQINNPLSEILATVEMLNLREHESNILRRKRLREIETSARRIQRVTLRLADIVDPEARQTTAGKMIELSAGPVSRPQSRLKAEHLGLEKAPGDTPERFTVHE